MRTVIMVHANSPPQRPISFFFYSGDRDEPAHIHVERDSSAAKFWLQPVQYQSSVGFSRVDLSRIARLVEDQQGHFLEAWNDYFGN